jgi:hypothetical protein
MSTATMAVRRNQNLYRTTTKLQLGPISVGFVMIALITLLALLYLTQITKTSVYGYKLSDLQQKQKQLQLAQEELRIESARLQAVQTIQNAPTVAKMVPQQNVTYAN